jgi:hypothetical protein
LTFIHKYPVFHRWGKISQRLVRHLRVWWLGLVLTFCTSAFAESDFHAGPLFDQFPLTLEIGHRTEAAGPFFYNQQRDLEKTWAVPPLFSHNADPAVESREDDFLYPLLTYERYGTQYRWQFIQLFSVSGGQEPEDSSKRRVTIFPIYFQQRSPDTNDNYTALVPFYGHLKDRLMRDEIFFVMFPIYSETRKRDVVTDNYLYPFFHLRRGDGLHGWQFWPLAGAEHKDVTAVTNGFGETGIIGGYDKFFALWPIHSWQNTGIGTDAPEKFRADLLLYSYSRSPKRDSTSVLWPFFTWIDDREKKYREWEGPYPFVVVARGEGKTATRVLPLFGRAHNDTFESDFYLWPLYKFNRLRAGALEQQRTRILFYLFQDVTERNTNTAAEKRRVDLWPLFTWHRDFKGNARLQILAPIEPMLPSNRGVERNWSPLWSLWRSEDNPATGASSRSLLWNLYRRDAAPRAKKISLLFGLFQYQSGSEGKHTRWFYIPVKKTKSAAGAAVNGK